MRMAAAVLSLSLLGGCALPAPQAAPPPAVTSEADLAELEAKIDAIAATVRGAGISAATGNIPAAADGAIKASGGIADVMREWALDLPEVLTAVLLSLIGVRYWRGPSTKKAKPA